jgi:hypothetical protein
VDSANGGIARELQVGKRLNRDYLASTGNVYRPVAAALPPLSELEKLTFNAILGQHRSTILRTAKALGIDLTDAEVEVILERLFGFKE